MHKRDGFTVVEIVVTLVVMGILLSISTMAYRGMQQNARDREREADVQVIATYLEGVYSQEIKSGGTVVKGPGSYPSINAVQNYFDVIFGDLARGADTPPGASSSALNPVSSTSGASRTDAYSYFPKATASSACTTIGTDCRSFQIHYKLESGESKVKESKRK